MSKNSEKDLIREIQLLKELLHKKDDNEILHFEHLQKLTKEFDQILLESEFELHQLEQIQNNLVSTENLVVAGFNISRRFIFGQKQGGDYFDLIPYKDRKQLLLLLASNEGHQISSEFMSVYFNQFEGLTKKLDFSFSEVMLEFFKLLQESLTIDKSHYIFSLFDRRAQKIEIFIWGEGIVFYKNSQDSIKIIDPLIDDANTANFKVKKLNETQISNKRCAHFIEGHLQDKSLFILLSKGVLDVLKPEEIIEILNNLKLQNSLHEVRNEILVQCQMKSGLEQPLRDQTIVVIEVQEQVIKLAKS